MRAARAVYLLICKFLNYPILDTRNVICHSSLVIRHSSLVIRHSSFVIRLLGFLFSLLGLENLPRF